MSNHHIVPIRPAALGAWEELQNRLDTSAPVPCHGRIEWISDHVADREFAVSHCTGCPALQACAEYADTAKERNGVWGGYDRNIRERQIQTLPLFENPVGHATMRPAAETTEGDHYMPRRNTPKPSGVSPK